MKKWALKKITKKINKNSTIKYFKINLYKNNKYINKFVLNLQDGIVSDEMLNSYFCNTLFKVKSFEDYVDLIEKLGLNICGYSPYRKYWMPSFKGLYLFVDRVGKTHAEVCTHSTYDNIIISNYNGFPTYDLTEKSVNLSKLGRLILL